MKSELKVIFHGLAQASVLLKSLFKLVADKLILLTTEKSETFSAKTLTFVVKPSERWFIQIKNNNHCVKCVQIVPYLIKSFGYIYKHRSNFMTVIERFVDLMRN